MWPFKKKPAQPKVQLRFDPSRGLTWWSVWVWNPGGLILPGYWKYVKGSYNEAVARKVYDCCVLYGAGDYDPIAEQSY
jgi:hypothetical protein